MKWDFFLSNSVTSNKRKLLGTDEKTSWRMNKRSSFRRRSYIDGRPRRRTILFSVISLSWPFPQHASAAVWIVKAAASSVLLFLRAQSRQFSISGPIDTSTGTYSSPWGPASRHCCVDRARDVNLSWLGRIFGRSFGFRVSGGLSFDLQPNALWGDYNKYLINPGSWRCVERQYFEFFENFVIWRFRVYQGFCEFFDLKVLNLLFGENFQCFCISSGA